MMAGGPLATTVPESSTVTRSHRPITNSMLCSTIRNVLPAAFSSRLRSAMWLTRERVTPPAGLPREVTAGPGHLGVVPRDADELQLLHRAPAGRGVPAAGRDQHVLQHGQAGEDPGQLEGPADSEGEDPVRGDVGD